MRAMTAKTIEVMNETASAIDPRSRRRPADCFSRTKSKPSVITGTTTVFSAGTDLKDGSGRTDFRQYFYTIEGMLTEVKANQMKMLGKDWVNEQQIIDGVLSGLGSKDLDDAATALRAAFGDRIGDLAAKLTAA